MAGCSAQPGRAGPGQAQVAVAGPTELVTRGDWNDVRAAVQVGLSAAEAALLSSEASPTTCRFELRTINDQAGTLTATRESAAAEDPTEIRLTARIGHFGDPERERRLLEAVARRLEDLAGVEFRRVR